MFKYVIILHRLFPKEDEPGPFSIALFVNLKSDEDAKSRAREKWKKTWPNKEKRLVILKKIETHPHYKTVFEFEKLKS